MNKIKMTLLGLGIFVGSTVFAQEQKSELTKEQRMEHRMDKFAEALELTVVQKEQVIELHKTSYEERQKIKNDESLDEVATKAAMKELRLQNKEKMDEILTEEQAAKMQALKEERKEERRADCKKKCEGKDQNNKRKSAQPEPRKQVLPTRIEPAKE